MHSMRLWRKKIALAAHALALVGSAVAPVRADAADALYEAEAIVTGTDMRQRPWGFAECLREVPVKISGDRRLKDDPRTKELAAHAERYVADFDYVDMMAGIKKNDDQGSYDRPHRLTVRFASATIDALLAELGETPWRGERPIIVPVLLVRGPKPPASVLNADSPAGAEQRGAFAEAARGFGMSVRMPSDTELTAWGASAEHFPFPDEPAPTTAPALSVSGIAVRMEAAPEAIVVGTLEWSETFPGWIGTWRTRFGGADHRWGIKGVNYDAAFRDIVAGITRLASGHGAPE
jgi:uncharacterized protein